MVRAIKFVVALLIALGIGVELGWIEITHPRLQHLHELLLKGMKLILYLFFP